jgi:hypothetical protein
MKKVVFLFVLLVATGLMAFIQSDKRFIQINNFSNAEERKPDRRGRSENEIVINRVSFPSAGYNVYIFHTNQNRFLRYSFNRTSTTAFDEAIVSNRNDSTFDIRLQNGGNQIDFFSLQCRGTQAYLWTETK